MKEYERHLIACDDDDCREGGGGSKLLKAAREQLGKEGRGVKCSKVSCLGLCKQGPVLIVYPEGVWYSVDDRKALDKIVEKMQDGKVAKKHVLFKMPPQK